MSRIDAEIYRRSQPLRMAYIDGKLDLCEEIKELAHILLARNSASPFKPTTDYEEGQVSALSAIIEACSTIEATVEQSDEQDKAFDA